jgi:hypothetical protein
MTASRSKGGEEPEIAAEERRLLAGRPVHQLPLPAFRSSTGCRVDIEDCSGGREVNSIA